MTWGAAAVAKSLKERNPLCFSDLLDEEGSGSAVGSSVACVVEPGIACPSAKSTNP